MQYLRFSWELIQQPSCVQNSRTVIAIGRYKSYFISYCNIRYILYRTQLKSQITYYMLQDIMQR